MARTKRRSVAAAKIVRLEVESIESLRMRFRSLRDNAMYCVGESTWMAEVKKLAGDNPTPEQWVEAAQKATTICDVCRGSGVYEWGACINGVMQHRGPCFRCRSRGRQGQQDYSRNRVYDNHRRAF